MLRQVLLTLLLLAGSSIQGEELINENALESSTSSERIVTTTLESASSTEVILSTTEVTVSTIETRSTQGTTETSTTEVTSTEASTEERAVELSTTTTELLSTSTTTSTTEDEVLMTTTAAPRAEENELQPVPTVKAPPPTSSKNGKDRGVINSFQDILKKVDDIASGAIIGTFDKEDAPNTPLPPTDDDKTKLSNQIRAALKYYKDYRKVAVPDANVPDPFPVPDFSKKMGGTPFTFFNTSMRGMSNYEIVHINTNLEKMQVYVEVFMPKLVILGNYTAKSWWKKAAGPFNVTLLDVTASGAAALSRDEDGNLMASDSEMNMQFRDGVVDFKNLGLMGNLLQGILSGAAPILFEAIKPAVMGEINDKIRNDINNRIKVISQKFSASNSSSPLEQAIEETRKYIKTNGYDPYHVQNYVMRKSVLLVNISEFTLTGVSDFYKASDIELSMDNGTFDLGLHIATKQLHGRCRWLFAIGKRFARTGWSNFTVSYIQTKFYVTQSLDISEHPVLRKLDINVGKILVDVSGLGKLDLVAETLVNTLPDILRHIIVDAIEIPVKIKAQEILDRIDVKDLLDKNLPELDRIGV